MKSGAAQDVSFMSQTQLMTRLKMPPQDDIIQFCQSGTIISTA